MVKFFVFSDIHCDGYRIKEILDIDADFFILAGDISDLRDELTETAEKLSSLKEKLWIMPGNNETEADIRKICKKFGFTFFHDKAISVEKFNFFGLGYSNATPFNTPGELSDEEIEKFLRKLRGLNNLILVCHAPPLDTAVDKTGRGNHVGSKSIRTAILEHSPLMFFCGHVHERAGTISMLNKTPLFSCGKQGFLIDLG